MSTADLSHEYGDEHIILGNKFIAIRPRRGKLVRAHSHSLLETPVYPTELVFTAPSGIGGWFGDRDASKDRVIGSMRPLALRHFHGSPGLPV